MNCKYYIYCPDVDGRLEKMGTFFGLVDALLYAYGLGDFVVKNDNGLFYHFVSSDFSKRSIQNAGFIEAFDFVTHNLLTSTELDTFKLLLRDSCY